MQSSFRNREQFFIKSMPQYVRRSEKMVSEQFISACLHKRPALSAVPDILSDLYKHHGGLLVWGFFFVFFFLIKGSTNSTPGFKLWALGHDNFWNILRIVTTKKIIPYPSANLSWSLSLGYKQTWTWGSDPVFPLLHTSQSCCKLAWLATSVKGTKSQKRKAVCKGQDAAVVKCPGEGKVGMEGKGIVEGTYKVVACSVLSVINV